MYTFTSAAILNSCNAAASSRRTRADDREYNYDLFYSLLEEGRRNPRPALADDDDRGGRREAEPACCCCPLGRAWKIAIRSFIVVAWLLVEAFVVSQLPTCKDWSDAFVWLFCLVMLGVLAGMLWLFTLDCFTDPEYHRKRRTHS